MLRNRSRSRSIRISSLVAILAMVAAMVGFNGAVGAAASGQPTIVSDQPDYYPGSTVTLTGANWDPNAAVHIVVNDTLGQTWKHEVDVTSANDGTVVDTFSLPSSFVAQYDVTASQGTLTATATFTDSNPSADLDQCANGPAGTPQSCNGANAVNVSNWINGNMGASKSLYFEGDSLPYRLLIDNVIPGTTTNHVTIAWDITKGGKHALDYLTTYNRTVTAANPCTKGVGTEVFAGCSGSASTFPIPTDTSLPFSQVAGNFTIFGGTITSVSSYKWDTTSTGCGNTTPPTFVGDQTRCITINFTPTVANPVIAWAGHIASRHDWGAGN